MKIASFVVARQCRVLARYALAPFRLLDRLWAGGPHRLLIAPQDIRTSDATRAEDIYAGYFAFGGRLVNTQGRSPFDLNPPSAEWAKILNGFGWLRHLRAADTALARVNARALVDDYLNVRGRKAHEASLDRATVARRVLAWLSQSTIVLEGADGDFYRRFMKALARDVAFLQDHLATPVDSAQLTAAIALAEYALCADTSERQQMRATAQLAAVLSQQILRDGGHISRNPQTLIDILLDLLPLRQAYAASNVAAPKELLNAIDRIIPMVRLLRMGDGSLALFNGMGVTAPDRLAIVLAYDDARGAPLMSAPHTGYHRLEAGDCIVALDAGRPPPSAFSIEAHAGCLAFQFSAGPDQIVVNCGAPPIGRSNARQAARQTAAHSTLIIDHVSSCRFAPVTGLEKIVAGQILSGPQKVPVKRSAMDDGILLEASHDGYARRFGLAHERRLALKADGMQLIGEDRLSPLKDGDLRKDAAAKSYVLRFHIHPGVTIMLAEDEMSATLHTPSGQSWAFEAGGRAIQREESVFFAAVGGIQPCEQLVIMGNIAQFPETQWSFVRL